MSDVKGELRRYLEDNFMMGSSITVLGDGESFLERRLLDSTGFLELIGHLEETYSITVEDDEMVPENLDSLDSVARFVMSKRGQ
jgi:acyl carrier protein